MLRYKAENADGSVIAVNCQGALGEGRLDLDQYYNAAIGILERGLSGLVQPSVPMEMRPILEP